MARWHWQGDPVVLEAATGLFQAYEATVFILEKWLEGEGDTDDLVEHAVKTIEARR